MAAERPGQPPPTRLEYSSGKLHIHYDDPASSSSSPNEATNSTPSSVDRPDQQSASAGSVEATQHMRPQEASAGLESAQKMVDVLKRKGLEVEWPGSLDRPVVVTVPEGDLGSLRSRLSEGSEEDAAEDDDWIWDVLQVYAEEI